MNGNHFPRAQHVALPVEVVDRLATINPSALALYAILQREHGGRDTFRLASSTANRLGWSLATFRVARANLVENIAIRCIHRGGRGAGDAPIYKFC